ncbi:hypothetical protein [Paracoccus sanguinis]|uniref:Uncharacterized protein n=1 Tax=Paracoccus sanguinis TaxID=1545044 RepID=A0A1H3AL28_9RHOB|nr:hypothetical protein [Paracoccus sanguinis]SDX29874.1 hypothetical protein SAMN05444276_104104 [Paracoccus sanguinis]
MDSRIPQSPRPAGLPAAPGPARPAGAPALDPTRRGGPHAAPHADAAGEAPGRARLRPDTAPGAAALMQAALGRSELPPPLELMAALDSALAHAPLADRAVPGLGRLVGAVIEDERFKLGRMLDLGRQ